jgi:transposase
MHVGWIRLWSHFYCDSYESFTDKWVWQPNPVTQWELIQLCELCAGVYLISICELSLQMDTSLLRRQSILTLLNTGVCSQREIARQLGIAYSTVNDVVRHYRVTGKLESSRCGRPPTNRLLSLHDERCLVRSSIINPLATARQLRDEVGAAHASVRTVQRSLKRGGRISYRPTASPQLNKKQRNVRLAWCRQHSQWTRLDWAKVCKGMQGCVHNLTMLFLSIFLVFLYYCTYTNSGYLLRRDLCGGIESE